MTIGVASEDDVKARTSQCYAARVANTDAVGGEPDRNLAVAEAPALCCPDGQGILLLPRTGL